MASCMTLPITILSIRSLHSATVLPSNSYYKVVASIFLVSAASCKAICGVALVRTSDCSQPHVLIKYTHILICIVWVGVPGTLVLDKTLVHTQPSIMLYYQACNLD